MLRSVSIALRCLHNLKVFHGIELSTGNVLLPCLIFCLFCAAKKRVNQRPFGGVVTRQIAVMLADFNFIEQNLCSVTKSDTQVPWKKQHCNTSLDDCFRFVITYVQNTWSPSEKKKTLLPQQHSLCSLQLLLCTAVALCRHCAASTDSPSLP